MIKEIIRELEIEHNIQADMIEAVVMSPYTFLRDLIASGDMESVRMPKLGLFIVKPHRLIKYETGLEENYGKELEKPERDYRGMAAKHVAKQGDGAGSSEESGDLR